MGFGQERDELRLGTVRVLELVDEDVSEASLELRSCRRGAAHEAEGKAHLVAKVDETVLAEELLVPRVRTGELALAARLLGEDVVLRGGERRGRQGGRVIE